MKCEDCEVLTKVMINCEGCPYVVCQSCYDHRHSGHRVKLPISYADGDDNG